MYLNITYILYLYTERERERELNLTKTTYALHLCRCSCGNVLKPKHETPKPESMENMLKDTAYPTFSGREWQSPHHSWTLTSSTSSWSPWSAYPLLWWARTARGHAPSCWPLREASATLLPRAEQQCAWGRSAWTGGQYPPQWLYTHQNVAQVIKIWKKYVSVHRNKCYAGETWSSFLMTDVSLTM